MSKNYSYKIVNLVESRLFRTTGKFNGTMFDDINGNKIYLCSNITQCKDIINKFYKNQSITIYKLNNKSFKLETNTNTKSLYTLPPLSYESVCLSKNIYFDVNDINKFYDDIDNIDNIQNIDKI